MNKHIFAVYWPKTSQAATPGATLVIKDSTMHHRVVRVVRLAVDEEIILFDENHNSTMRVCATDKKDTLELQVISVQPNTLLKPFITCVLPVLKREALHQAIYSLVELGANEIQLVTTHKSQHVWGGQRELARLHVRAVAAAEQSKHFAIPSIKEPIELRQHLGQMPGSILKLFFDPQGTAASDVVLHLQTQPVAKLILLVGPEGDLNEEEKEELRKHNFLFCALTPTILRASQAAAISLGLVRSLVRG